MKEHLLRNQVVDEFALCKNWTKKVKGEISWFEESYANGSGNKATDNKYNELLMLAESICYASFPPADTGVML